MYVYITICVLTLLQVDLTFPFPVASHPLRPSKLWGYIKKPFPSGAWFTNLAIGKGDMPVVVLPYVVKTTSTGVGFSYSAALRTVTNTRIQVFDGSSSHMSLVTPLLTPLYYSGYI